MFVVQIWCGRGFRVQTVYGLAPVEELSSTVETAVPLSRSTKSPTTTTALVAFAGPGDVVTWSVDVITSTGARPAARSDVTASCLQHRH